MKVISAKIKNFRKLENVSLSFDDKTTVIVGRNNTGKTSTAEIFRSFLSGNAPSLKYVDFCHSCFNNFIKAIHQFKKDQDDEMNVRRLTPSIDLELIVDYTDDADDYGVLSDFIIDLDENLFHTKILVSYKLKDGEIRNFYSELEPDDPDSFYSNLKKKIDYYFESVAFVVDPTNEENRVKIDFSKIRKLLLVGIINAQRGLNDETYSERDVLGKSLGTMFSNATSITAPQEFQEKSKEIQSVVDKLQEKVNSDFQDKVAKLLPQLALFGYPGIGDTELSASTELNVKSLLDSHTKVYYKYGNYFTLPETYNGLGFRNLIYILFRIYEYFIEYQSQQIPPKGQIIFIEEPEAHLHPQMQEVFISQLNQIIKVFQEQLGNNQIWPIQFIVSTHSSHVANKADFNQIRYFLSKENNTQIKDLGNVFKSEASKNDKEFLQKFLTLTKCDLYFADVAILVEGATERILLPEIIRKFDEKNEKKLSSKYLSVVEIGGAYAHHFYKLLNFLELKTLVITDLDSIKKTVSLSGKGIRQSSYSAWIVSESTHTSNQGLKHFFLSKEDALKPGYMDLSQLINLGHSEKVKNSVRIAYQIPELNIKKCGRSFEDAFILANLKLFDLDKHDESSLENAVFEKAESIGKNSKANFAIEYAIEKLEWIVPRYIIEGLEWISEDMNNTVNLIEDITKEVVVL